MPTTWAMSRKALERPSASDAPPPMARARSIAPRRASAVVSVFAVDSVVR
jgi:hypothetical protein